MTIKAGQEPVCVILAAGLSKRFGRAKMLHTINPGERLIEATIACYKPVFKRLLVVIRETDTELAELLDKMGVNSHRLAADSLGMSQSLVAGVQASGDAGGWLIALGDMPYVQSQTIGRLKDALRHDNIVMPRHRGQVGNPVGFGSNFGPELVLLTGDSGARSITRRADGKVVFVDTDDAGILQDIDYPTDIN